MKKLLYILLFLILPAIASAEVKHTRSLAEPMLFSPVILDIAVNNYDQDINCGGLKFWGVLAIQNKTGNRFFGTPRFVSSAILSQKFTFDLPMGDIEELTFVCSEDGENEAFQFGSIENDLGGDQVLFSSPTFLADETKIESFPIPIPEPTPFPELTPTPEPAPEPTSVPTTTPETIPETAATSTPEIAPEPTLEPDPVPALPETGTANRGFLAVLYAVIVSLTLVYVLRRWRQ